MKDGKWTKKDDVWVKEIEFNATLTEEGLEAIKTIPGIRIINVKPRKPLGKTTLTGISAWKDDKCLPTARHKKIESNKS